MRSLSLTLAKWMYRLVNNDEMLIYLLLISLLSLEVLMVIN